MTADIRLGGAAVLGKRSEIFRVGVVGLLLGAMLVSALASQAAASYRRPGKTERISVKSDGTEAQRPALDVLSSCPLQMDITPNGRFVAFNSVDVNLVAGDANLGCDVFVRDRKKNTTERVSVSDGEGLEATLNSVVDGIPASMDPSISANGRYVAFTSSADNLVAGDTNEATDVFVHDRKTNSTVRVSVNSNGEQTTASEGDLPSSDGPSISANGRFVVFVSLAENLIPEGIPGAAYRHDLKTGKTVGASYTEADALMRSTWPSVNADGRYVVFSNSTDVWVRDMEEGKTTLASTTVNGSPSAGSINGRVCICDAHPNALGGRQISANGRYVVFVSTAPDHVPSDQNDDPDCCSRPSSPDIFVRDLVAERTERISVRSTGAESAHGTWLGPTQPSPSGFSGSISSDGRFVTFTSASKDLIRKPPAPDEPASGEECILVTCVTLPGTSPYTPAVYVHDRATGELSWASPSMTGREPAGSCPVTEGTPTLRGSWAGAISEGGRYVLFASCGSDLIEKDENNAYDFFVFDRGWDVGVGGLGGPPNEEEDPGQELCVGDVCVPQVCISDLCIPPGESVSAKDLSARSEESEIDPAADLLDLTVAYRPESADLFVRAEVDHLPTLGKGNPDASGARSRALLHVVSFGSNSGNYEIRMTAAKDGIFGLFKCGSGPICTEITRLEGGYGTTGHRLTLSLPLEAIELSEGGVLSDFKVTSGLGSYVTGVIELIDRIAL